MRREYYLVSDGGRDRGGDRGVGQHVHVQEPDDLVGCDPSPVEDTIIINIPKIRKHFSNFWGVVFQPVCTLSQILRSNRK